MCEWSYRCPAPDLGIHGNGRVDRGSFTDFAVDETSVGADFAACSDDCASLQDGAREQGHILADAHVDIDEGLARIEHRDAVEEPSPVGSGSQFALGESQLPSIVDTRRKA